MPDSPKEFLENCIVIDGLFHSLLDNPPPTDVKKDIVDLLLDGGVSAINATVLMDKHKNDFSTYAKELYRFLLLEEVFPEKVLIVQNYDDILQAKENHKLGIILGMQGADALEYDLRYISLLHRLGVRIIQITYNQRNNLGCGVFEPHDSGLTRFGQQSIYEMNRLGILVDLSHVGEKTSLDAIELSNDPVIISHSSVRNLCEHTRNISDVQIREVAAKGGIVGLCPHSVMCIKEKGKRPTVGDFIDHIEYIINLVGDDHVAIGTDRWYRPTQAYKLNRAAFERTLPGFFGSFSGDEKHVEGFNYYDEWENLVYSLDRRGFSSEQIQKTLGGNFCRVFKEVWKKS